VKQSSSGSGQQTVPANVRSRAHAPASQQRTADSSRTKLKLSALSTYTAWPHRVAATTGLLGQPALSPKSGDIGTIKSARSADPCSASDTVAITQEAVPSRPAHVLLGNVGHSDLVVVGSHGHAGFVAAMLGAISQ
jgi:hypothetical protein